MLVVTDVVPQVADDTQELPGACGRRLNDRTGRAIADLTLVDNFLETAWSQEPCDRPMGGVST